MTNAAYTTHGQFRPAGPQSPDQAGMPNTPVLALIALITPTALWMEFNLIGRIFAPELILIGLLPFLLLARGRMLMSPSAAHVSDFWRGFGLFSQVLTDLIRDTPVRRPTVRGLVEDHFFFTMNFLHALHTALRKPPAACPVRDGHYVSGAS